MKIIKKLVLTMSFMVGLFVLSSEGLAEGVVKDDAGILSTETIQYIQQLNNDQLSSLYGSPEYGVVTVDSLDGKSIEETAQQIFDTYTFGSKEYNNGLLFVMAVEDRQFRMTYGAGFTSAFQHMTGDDWVNEEVKQLFREENYDEGIRQISANACEKIIQLDQKQGLANAYEEGAVALEQRQSIKQAEDKRLLIIIFSIIGTAIAAPTVGIAGYLTFRRRKIKQQFEQANVIPSHMENDPIFKEKDFLKWLGKNKKRFHDYIGQANCLAGLQAYTAERFFHDKLAVNERLNTADKQLLTHAMANQRMQHYYAERYLNDSSYTFNDFLTAVQAANEVLNGYAKSVGETLFSYMKELDLSSAILPANQELLPEYKKAIERAALKEIRHREQSGVYLSQVVIDQQTRELLDNQRWQEVSDVVEQVKQDALFRVDLEKVYDQHPDLKERLADFSDDEVDEVLQSVRGSYHFGTTDYAMLYLLMANQITHQEEVIASNNSDFSDFGGGGGISGGGASGSW